MNPAQAAGKAQPKQAPMGDSVDMTQNDVGVEIDMGPISLAEDAMRGGWTKTSTGAPGLPPPAPMQMGCGGDAPQGYGDASTDTT